MDIHSKEIKDFEKKREFFYKNASDTVSNLKALELTLKRKEEYLNKKERKLKQDIEKLEDEMRLLEKSKESFREEQVRFNKLRNIN